jgi:hypothetical protein
LLAGVALALLASAPSYAATYQIGLLQGGTGTGMGTFNFTNTGTSGSATASLSTNASSTIGVQTFVPGSITVQVVAVDFRDGKPQDNHIRGNFVEGITGILQTAVTNGLRTSGPCAGPCFFRITFAFTANSTNPDAALKTYMIQLVRQNGVVEETPVPSGNYSVANTATIPEPGSLALLALALAALGWAQARRKQVKIRSI